MPKPRPQKLCPDVFLAAGQETALGRECFSCIAVRRAARLAGLRSDLHLKFYEDLFEINFYWNFADHGPGVRNLRLMALALAHTLAVEQNAGRRVL